MKNPIHKLKNIEYWDTRYTISKIVQMYSKPLAQPLSSSPIRHILPLRLRVLISLTAGQDGGIKRTTGLLSFYVMISIPHHILSELLTAAYFTQRRKVSAKVAKGCFRLVSIWWHVTQFGYQISTDLGPWTFDLRPFLKSAIRLLKLGQGGGEGEGFDYNSMWKKRSIDYIEKQDHQ